eukprot:13937114-Ditylum_brightwellii.AAC.1
MKTLWNSSVEEQYTNETIKGIVEQIQDWGYTIREADNTYVALAALALAIPDRNSNNADMTQIIDTIYDTIIDSYHCHSFESEDVAHITLGLIAVRLAQNVVMDKVDSVVDILVGALHNGDGKQCFGSMLGLGMISQSLCLLQAQNIASSSNSVSTVRMQRIISTLLEEFHACLDQKVPAILNLIACVKGGKPTPDMLKLCTGMDESYLYVHDSKRKKFKSLCVALSLALPSLSQVNIDLLLGTYQILDKCPWGSGK